MKRIICWIKAIPLFLKCGAWCPHIYEEKTFIPSIIISHQYGFRVSDDYRHGSYETVHPKATLIVCKCLCCGKEELSWFDGSYDDIPVVEG